MILDCVLSGGSATGSNDSSIRFLPREVCTDQMPLLPQVCRGRSTDCDTYCAPSVTQQHHLCTPSLADAASTSCTAELQSIPFNLPSSRKFLV
jgi:hypothetical protein